MLHFDERAALMLLATLIEPGDAELDDLISQHGPVEAVDRIWSGEVGDRLRRITAPAVATGTSIRVRIEAIQSATDTCGARVIIPGDTEWPPHLHDLDRLDLDGEPHLRPPRCLWVRGNRNLAAVSERAVTITGSRATTEYGKHLADDLAADLSEADWTVVTGGGLGIDRAAATGAMARDGATVAVLAAGVDARYPQPTRSLLDLVAERGLLISEWPPGASAMRHRFLLRGRVLAALTAGTVVVEAAQRSAALSQVRYAVALGRTLMFTPGPVTSAQSVGVHLLARKGWGARLVTSARDVLDDLADDAGSRPIVRQRVGFEELPEPQQRLVEVLPRGYRIDTGRLAAAAGCPVEDANEALNALRVAGWVESIDGRWKLSTSPRRT